MKTSKITMLLSLSALIALCASSIPAYAAVNARGSAYTNDNAGVSVNGLGVGVSAEGQANVNARGHVEATSSENGSSTATGTATGTAAVNSSSTVNNEIGIEHRSAVANAVQELLGIADRTGGIGQEIRVIAQAQEQNQVKLDTAIGNIQNRNGVAKFFIGPNFGAINDAERIIVNNQQQIQVLTQLQSEVTSTADQQQLTNQINVLQQTNTQLNAYVQAQSNGFSVFGWLVKLFVK